MLKAYLDDSGTHAESPLCVVAGYWGSVNQWKKFEREWKPILDRYHVDEFHAKVFWGRDKNLERVGPYKGWSDDKRHRFLDELLAVIGGFKLYPFAHGVVSAEWNQRSTTLKKFLSGGAGEVSE